MVFCVSWQFFRNFPSHSTRRDWNTFSVSFIKALWIYAVFFFFFSSENLSALADTFVTWWWWQNYHLFCLLSLQKPEVKSYGALSREVQKQAWLWKWGTGWLDKQAENLPTAAWIATAQKESEWCWQSGGLPHASLESSFSPPSVFPSTPARMLCGTDLTVTGWFAAKKTFAYLPLRNVTLLAFYINGNRFGEKVFHFKGKMLKYNRHKGKFALPWNNT